MLEVEVIATDALGDRSYVVHDGVTALVIDPQRDIDRVQQLLTDRALTLSLVVETHRHNDYVTGGYALAAAAGATYVVPGGEDITVGDRTVVDGDQLEVGALQVAVLGTPGHTHGHVAYVVSEPDGSTPPALFSGGSLLFGSVGRTDLLGPADAEGLTRDQYRSARRLATELPDETRVYPTHGFGSFCSSGSATGGDSSTIGEQKQVNDALTTDDEDTFVTRLLAGLDAYPAYYAHMGARNKQGPSEPDLSPADVTDPEEIRKRIAAGEWIVDLRERRTFAAAHVSGSVSVALGTQFATYLGWLIPWETPVTLIADTPEQIADAQRQLVRIGIERPAGSSTEPVAALAGEDGPRSYPTANFADLAQRQQAASGQPGHGHDDGHPWVVLDVRRDDERAAGAIPGSVHVPLHSLIERIDEVPEATLWVHCASGFRASIAASLLDRAGRDVVYLDDEYSSAVQLGLAPS
ncbi:MBL fold metallo-hydrolase [Modestobacter muralis]|uniref:MBL fold metallo-hydrolase n=1 Tax=Modestobacter muralis TaxID=1608614 RepID=A0A6P0H8S8_9ACTN|nr:rhodanese-like domain-containing protein [Modestobacter muralis]NEK95152.1 MBL fold metallo-hydrolase [Modestobacter muralis]NEN52040.1 MBL fold metallo-hydrolase [Modestobacter muralis]